MIAAAKAENAATRELAIEFFPQPAPPLDSPPNARFDAAWSQALRASVGYLAQIPEGDVGGPIMATAKRLGADGALVGESEAGREVTILAALGTDVIRQLETTMASRSWRELQDRIAPHDPYPTASYFSGAVGIALGLAREAGQPTLFAMFVGPRLGALDPVRRSILSFFLELLACFRPRGPIFDYNGARRLAGSLILPPGAIPLPSESMRGIYDQLAVIAASELPILLTGESGVGKEHLARAIHLSSPRARGPFVALNCAAFPADLFEAELFGIARGVATGVSERRGRFQEADGGTLFLDEIGELPAPLQPKLLRALQENEVQVIGGPSRAVDIRILAATNLDPAVLLGAQRLRSDLYYRLAGGVVNIPSLRDRPQDIPALLRHLVLLWSRGKRVRGLTQGAYRALLTHTWPGNTRELENEVRRLLALCPDGGTIDESLLSPSVRTGPPASVHVPDPSSSGLLDQEVSRIEVQLIRDALKRSGGNRKKAAESLGISRNGLALKMGRLRMERVVRAT